MRAQSDLRQEGLDCRRGWLVGLNGLADGEEEHHSLIILHAVVTAKDSHKKYARFREGMWEFYSVVSKSISLCVWMKFCHSVCGRGMYGSERQ